MLSRVLRQKGLWLPSIQELNRMREKTNISQDVYDCGIAILGDGEPNQETAQTFANHARERNWKLPLIVSPRGLDYVFLDKEIKLIPSRQIGYGITHGPQAEEIIARVKKDYVNCPTTSGAFRLMFMDNRGTLCDHFRGSHTNGKMGWVCGEAEAVDLRVAYGRLVDREAMCKKQTFVSELTHA